MLVGVLVLARASGVRAAEPAAQISGWGFTLEVDQRTFTRLVAVGEGARTELGPYRASDFVVVAGRALEEFSLQSQSEARVSDAFGAGLRLTVIGARAGLRKELRVTVYDDVPALAVVEVDYQNQGPRAVRVDRWVSRRGLVRGKARGGPAFWSYQGGSYPNRPDWVRPLRVGFAQRNFMGMNASDYGGGTPVVDVWRRDVGVAVGHLAPVPRLVSLPVSMDARGATAGIEEEVGRTLAPGQSLGTGATFVAVHRGDHFVPLVAYRTFMAKVGVKIPKFGDEAYRPIWCGWGYERGVTVAQMEGTLGKAAELGFRVAVLDDGWQRAIGDWQPDPRKFPAGDADMKALTAKMRGAGLAPMLWWAPLAAHPASQLGRTRPDLLLLDRKGRPQKISWWDVHLLCPAYEPVRALTRDLVRSFLGGWDYDGLKLDGQHLNGVPPCHNPAHGHRDPGDAVTALPQLFELIAETARAEKSATVLELCPCGTGYAFHSLPFTNLPAASDPESSWQVRSKGKTLKALLGPSAPYFGDHVELSDGGDDFASTVGVGGVVGTQFTLSELPPSKRKYQLTPRKELLFRRWVAIYNHLRLSQGEYLGGLYDLGFDRPEAHAIRKGDRMYYAFFAPRFSGELALRGLVADRGYRVHDYVMDRPLGRVRGPVGRLPARFGRHLLLEVVPEDESSAR